MNDRVDVLVVGGGQAGLAASYRLSRAGASHIVVDASARIGDSWRRRYDSLTLFTPRTLSALPGLSLLGEPEGYAGRDEFADYLENYAETFSLPVLTGTRVERLFRRSDGAVEAGLAGGGVIVCRSVVDCTGAFQRPWVPRMADQFGDDVLQLTSGTYSNPADVPPGTVLVVGDGASGRDIAVDLAATHRVLLATGKPRRLFPERFLGQSTWTWMDRLGLLSATSNSAIGRIMKAADPFPDRGRSLKALRAMGIDVWPRLEHAGGRRVQFANRTTKDVDAVIWAVGYRDDDGWLGADGSGVHRLGRPWLRNRASGLVLGAARDSETVIDRVLAELGQP
ncbi:putative flavoprotein involved in K+ transport [Devosia lucknowensis]|uniref:Putative flavoprotein involved in K+ transport n=1 Tax=Devosia lucknowensis TaxID=1096929 RepID=A0A1Y6F271_9HYPH|nr:NAD(P)/FAD-dependent oxidoreductase [Devosia lucknowensis]SMQ68566.1 putative flavoprotein involved in K+ transport [Devosia lucknowensis]